MTNTAQPWTRFSLQTVIANTREYQREYKLSTAQAIEGICEGHELLQAEETELRQHFGVRS